MPAPTDLSGRLKADELVQTSAERDALERLREVADGLDGPMERHSLRCFLIAERLADVRGIEVDREVLLVAALLHDIGLYDGASRGGVYVTDGKEFAAELLADREDWDAARIQLCLDAIERHHEIRSQWGAGNEVEFIRRADLVDLSGGLISYGGGRSWQNTLWAAVPRDGTYREIGGMVLKAARERPSSLPKIFLRAG